MKPAIVRMELVVGHYNEAIEFCAKKLNFEPIEDTYHPIVRRGT